MKRVRTTSAAVYRDLQPSLQRRESIVLDALKTWRGQPPTGYELTKALQEQGDAFDVNAVRPRLTSLQEKGLVATGEKRTCTVTGRTVLTWVITVPRVARQPEAQRLEF